MPNQIAPNVLSWASIVENTAADQAIALAALPFVTPHIALMPSL